MVSTPAKILLIEDDTFLAKMLSRMLESHAYAVELAGTGKEGLEKARNVAADLILLDIMLPDIDGFDVLERLKTENILERTPVIILSNLGQSEDREQGKALGATDYLVKSDMSLDDVVEKVRKYVPPR